MKKFISIFMFFLLLIFLIPLTSCEADIKISQATVDEIIGTYKLSKYEQENDSGIMEDVLSNNSIVSYLVINESGHGYYLYEDNNTEFFYTSVLALFIKEDLNNDIVGGVKIYAGTGKVKMENKKPGCGDEPLMGFNVNSCTLSWKILKHTYLDGNEEKQVKESVAEYTKVDLDTTLTYASNKLNKSLTSLSKYEFKNISSPLIYANDDENSTNYNKYSYFIIDINYLQNPTTATIYYKLNGSEDAVVQENVNINLKYPNYINNSSPYVSLTIMGQEYKLDIITSSYTPNNYIYSDIYTEPDSQGNTVKLYRDRFNCYSGNKTTIAEIINEIAV